MLGKDGIAGNIFLDTLSMIRVQVEELDAHPEFPDLVSHHSFGHDAGFTVQVEAQCQDRACWKRRRAFNEHSSLTHIPGIGEHHCALGFHLGCQPHTGMFPPVTLLVLDQTENQVAILGGEFNELQCYPLTGEVIADDGLCFDVGQVLGRSESEKDLRTYCGGIREFKEYPPTAEDGRPGLKSLVADSTLDRETGRHTRVFAVLLACHELVYFSRARW